MDSITESTDMNLSKLWKTVKDRAAGGAAVHGVANIFNIRGWFLVRSSNRAKRINERLDFSLMTLFKSHSPFPFSPVSGQTPRKTLSSRPPLELVGNLTFPCLGTFHSPTP